MLKINDVNIIEPKSKAEIKMFSIVMHHVKKIRYGSVTLEVKIHNDKIKNVQCREEKHSYAIDDE